METKIDAAKLARDIDKLLAKKGVSFEETLEALEQVAEVLDGGQAKLEESLLLFERGVQLTQRCQKILQEAELKVRKLTESKSGEITATPLRTVNDGEEGTYGAPRKAPVDDDGTAEEGAGD